MPGPETPAEEGLELTVIRNDSFDPRLGPLIGALAKAQGAFEVPERSKTVTVKMKESKGGGTYTFSYAPLDKIMAAVRKPLSENGLAVAQILLDNLPPTLVTRLMHESGGVLESRVLIRAEENSPQAFGSALTYFRRYTLSALLGIVVEEDDDGNHASGNSATQIEKNGTSDLAAKPMSAGQKRMIWGLAKERLGVDSESTQKDVEAKLVTAKLLTEGVEITTLTTKEASHLIGELQKLPKPEKPATSEKPAAAKPAARKPAPAEPTDMPDTDDNRSKLRKEIIGLDTQNGVKEWARATGEIEGIVHIRALEILEALFGNTTTQPVPLYNLEVHHLITIRRMIREALEGVRS